MALGNTNISIATVQGAIGVYSTSSLGALIAKAKTGGTGGYAFYIYETRASNGNRYDGYLISGAEPHWNMWSNKIPAEWDYTSGNMELRLKRNPLNQNGGYDFRLHDFRGYDHAAVRPTLSPAASYTFTGGVGEISWLMHFHQIALPTPDITHILAKVTIGAQVKYKLVALSDISDSTPEVAAQTLSFTGVSETSGSIQLYASNSISQQIATLTNIVDTKSFTIVHAAQFAYLSRGVAMPDGYPDYNASATIIVPTGTGNIEIAAGTTSLSGITIRVIGSSSSYSTLAFDLYLSMTGESDVYVGTYYVPVSSTPIATDLQSIGVTLNSATAAGDALAFKALNVSVF